MKMMKENDNNMTIRICRNFVLVKWNEQIIEVYILGSS